MHLMISLKIVHDEHNVQLNSKISEKVLHNLVDTGGHGSAKSAPRRHRGAPGNQGNNWPTIVSRYEQNPQGIRK